jgi:hypothetical protein
MPSLKKISLILGLLTSFVTINEGVLWAQDNKSYKSSDETLQKMGNSYPARVMSTKAIVYADENMNSPLGFISNGKLITVGNPRKLNRELVPLIVYGRIAFIQIKDIRYEDDEHEFLSNKTGAPREHDVDITIVPIEEKLSENNSGYFTFGQYLAGDDLNELSQAIDGEEKSTISVFGAQFIHRKENARVFYGAGFDYGFASTTDLDFTYFSINPTFGYTFMRNSAFLAEIYGSFDFSVSTYIDVKNNYENEPSGFLYGPQINARIVLFPSKKYHLTGGMGLKKYWVHDLNELLDANGNLLPGISSLNGFQLSVGFGVEF